MTTAIPDTVDITLNPKIINNVYYPLFRNRSRYEIFYGGAGSGKSVFVAQRMVYRLLGERGHHYLVIRKVGRTNRHSTFALLSSIIRDWKLKPLFRINKSDMEITAANGNTVIFSGLDDVEKLKSISGITDIWVEEASEISKEDFQQLDLRLRGNHVRPLQLTLTFNPVSSMSWLKGYFFDRPKDNCKVVKTTYKDNRFLDDQYRAVIENLKNEDATFYQIYALGEWGTLGNLVYSNWEVHPGHAASFDETLWGLDFGFNNPTALIGIGIRDGEPWIFSEVYRTGMTNSDLISVLRQHVRKGATIYADCAEPARIEEIAREGFRIYPADKSVKDGIDFVKRKHIKVYPDCVNVISEFNSYSWRKDKDGNIIDEPVKFNDHAMDAIRYALYTGLKDRGRWKAW